MSKLYAPFYRLALARSLFLSFADNFQLACVTLEANVNMRYVPQEKIRCLKAAAIRRLASVRGINDDDPRVRQKKDMIIASCGCCLQGLIEIEGSVNEISECRLINHVANRFDHRADALL